MKLILADLVLLVIGIILFATAGTALYVRGDLSPATTSATGVFNVAFTTEEVLIGEQNIEDAQMASSSWRFDVTSGNVSEVLVEVSCTDGPAGGPRPFTVSVRVTGPDGAEYTEDETCDGPDIALPIPITDVPEETAVQANTEEEAQANLAPQSNATKANGRWLVSISGNRGDPVSIPQNPVPPPTGSVRFSVTEWSPSFTALAR